MVCGTDSFTRKERLLYQFIIWLKYVFIINIIVIDNA